MNAKADDKTLEAAIKRAGAPQTRTNPGSIFSVQWSPQAQAAHSREAAGGDKLLPAAQLRSDEVPATAAGTPPVVAGTRMSLASLRGSPLEGHAFDTPTGSGAWRGSDESFAMTKSSARSSTYSVSPRGDGTWLGEVVTATWFTRLAVGLVLLNMAIMCMPYQVTDAMSINSFPLLSKPLHGHSFTDVGATCAFSATRACRANTPHASSRPLPPSPSSSCWRWASSSAGLVLHTMRRHELVT